jgi:hypothetical protein
MQTEDLKPTTHDLILPITSIDEYGVDDAGSATKAMLWYKKLGKKIPLDVFLDADVTLSEYQEYVSANFSDHEVSRGPNYKLEDVISRAFPDYTKRAAVSHVKRYCKLSKTNYAELKKTTFNAHQAQNLLMKLKTWKNPKSRKSAASKAGEISAMVRYARAHDNEFHEYLEQTHSKKIRDNLALLWILHREKRFEFNHKPDRDKANLFGTLKSFLERNKKKEKKSFGGARKREK